MKPSRQSGSIALLLWSFCVALLLGAAPCHGADDTLLLLDKAIERAVFSPSKPDTAELTPSDLSDLTLVLELEDAKTILRSNLHVFSFLEKNRIPSYSQRMARNTAEQKKYLLLDARKAAMVTWLMEQGAKEQITGKGGLADPKKTEKLGQLLEASATSSGSQSLKALLESAATEKISATAGRSIWNGAVKNAWLFPETVKVLSESDVPCGQANSKGDDLLVTLMENSLIAAGAQSEDQEDTEANGSTAPAARNFSQTMDTLLKSKITVSPAAIKAAIELRWAEGLEKLLIADPQPDTSAYQQWLVAAKLADRNYPDEVFQKIKAMIAAAGQNHKNTVKAMPKIRLYFTGFDETHGEEPWVSDGTEEGTRMLFDLNPGPQGSDLKPLGAGSKGLIATGLTEGRVRRLFSLSPTVARPVELLTNEDGNGQRDAQFGNSAMTPDGYVLFSDYQSEKLWQSDGTRAGTMAVADGKLAIRTFGMVSDKLMLYGTPIAYRNGRKDTSAPAQIYQLIPSKRQLIARWAGSGANLNELNVGNHLYALTRDGVVVGPSNPSANQSNPSAQAKNILLKGRLFPYGKVGVQMGNHFYFAADYRKEVANKRFTSAYGVELFRTDGTEEGTALVADIREEIQDQQGSRPENLFALGKTLLFTADDGQRGRRIWAFDGESTRMLNDSLQLNSSFVSFESKAYFLFGRQLWSTDGTPEGTVLVREFEDEPKALTNAGRCLVFAVADSQRGVSNAYVLWRSDGTVRGTQRIASVIVGRQSKLISAPLTDDQPETTTREEAPEPQAEKLPEKKFKPKALGDN